MYLSLDSRNIIRATSNHPMTSSEMTVIETDKIENSETLLGRKVVFGDRPDLSDIRIAVICNWGDQCGIATYTKLLIDAIRPKVGELRIFAEHVEGLPEEEGVVRCWRRGESMVGAINQIKEWGPDLIHIQHEFGIFPKATHLLKMLEMLDDTPYVVTAHAVYEHLDKTVCTSYIKDIIVHSNEAEGVLRSLGHSGKVYVVHHGCVEYPDTSELWNTFQNEHTIIQFGFGFGYKGVDQAIDAIRHLTETEEDLKDIFYCYLCSENPHTRLAHQDYLNYLRDKVAEYGLEENVVVLRGFQDEKILGNFLRTAKLAIFPYKTDEHNVVYGASGAVRNAMANGIPVIASDSHLFDDLEGIIPRAHDSMSLAEEISKVFKSDEYRLSLRDRNLQFVRDNNWDMTADKHLDVYNDILGGVETDTIRI